MSNQYISPVPVIDKKETASLETLANRYNKLLEPSLVAKLGTKMGERLPQKLKDVGQGIGQSISEAELYSQIMKLLGSGFQVIEEYAAKYSISEKTILSKINKHSQAFKVESLEEICLVRSYDIAKAVNSSKGKEIVAAAIEGGGTGYAGFWGLPANIVLSTFLYFRAVQSIAMFYGYDVKNDYAELAIASDVFTKALSPEYDDVNNEATGLISKIMVMSQAAVVQQTAKKTWTDMAYRGGIPLLLTQLRALANKSAQKALQNASAKGLENTLFKEAFEQIGKKLTLKSIRKSVPVASTITGALIDTSQMNKVLEYADIFYHLRFIHEKQMRIDILLGGQDSVAESEMEETEIVDVDFLAEEV